MAIRKKKEATADVAPLDNTGGAAARAADNRDRLKAMKEVVSLGLGGAKPAAEVAKEVSVVPTIFPNFDCGHVGGFPTGRLALVQGPSSEGKALADGTPVLTPSGWVAIEQLKVGQRVIGKDGTPYSVLGVYPQGVKDLYQVMFSGGGEVSCSGDHLWFTTTKKEEGGGKGSVKSTDEIIATLGDRHWIDIVDFDLETRSESGERKRYIASIQPVGRGPCTCIKVDSPDSLFVCKDFIVTHNTPFAIGVMRSFLEADHFAYFIDAEMSTPAPWLKSLMGDMYEHPGFTMSPHVGTYEEVRRDVRKWCEGIAKARDAKKISQDTSGIIVLDSLKKLVPEKMWDELAKSAGDGKKGQDKGHVDGFGGRGGQYKASLNAAWVDELTPLLANTNMSMIMITREKVEMSNDWIPRKIITSMGGKDVKYDSSLWLRVISQPVTQKLGDDDKALVGHKHIVEIHRSKVKALHDKVVSTCYHTSNGVICPEGFDRPRDVFELALEANMFEKSGSYFAFEGEVLGQGEVKAVDAIRSNPELMRIIEDKCRTKLMELA